MKEAATVRSIVCPRVRLTFLPTDFSKRYNSTKKIHPFRNGALVTKDEVQAFQRPASEIRLGLATTMWLQIALNELQISHPMHSILLDRLENEPASPSSPSSSAPPSEVSKKLTRLDELPAEIRLIIYGYSLSELEPISPILGPPDPEGVHEKGDYITSGFPVLSRVFPNLHDEISTMFQSFYQANMFQFDLREDNGIANLVRWIEERQDEACAAKTISVVHWTWYWSSSDFCWTYVADATILSLTSTGHIKLTRTSGLLDADACNCDMGDLISAQCEDWTMNKPWTMADFVKALRQDEELLIQALTKFVDLIQHHTESFHAWQKGPKDCSTCGKQMIFLRTFDDVEWTSE